MISFLWTLAAIFSALLFAITIAWPFALLCAVSILMAAVAL